MCLYVGFKPICDQRMTTPMAHIIRHVYAHTSSIRVRGNGSTRLQGTSEPFLSQPHQKANWNLGLALLCSWLSPDVHRRGCYHIWRAESHPPRGLIVGDRSKSSWLTPTKRIHAASRAGVFFMLPRLPQRAPGANSWGIAMFWQACA